MGLRKSMGSVEAVTTTERQKRCAAMAAPTSMRARTSPPKRVPRGLAMCGKAVRTLVTQLDITGSSEMEGTRRLYVRVGAEPSACGPVHHPARRTESQVPLRRPRVLWGPYERFARYTLAWS